MATKINNIETSSIISSNGWGGTGSKAKKLGGIPLTFQCERGNKSFVGDNISFGDSESIGNGVCMPYDGKMVVATLQCTGISGVASITAIKNGTLCSDYSLISSNFPNNCDVKDFNDEPLEFVAGDVIGWQTTGAPGAASSIHVMFVVIFD